MNLLLATSIPCWLIPLLVGAISAILGYLLGRLFGGGSDNKVDVDVYKSRISKLEADLAACRSSKDVGTRSSGAGNTVTSFASGAATTAVTGVSSAKETTSTGIQGVAFDADAAKAAFGKKIKENDLTVVEGIGPKIRELFHNNDVKTWVALADCSVDKCKAILKSGGKRFEMHKPGTWPEQSSLAAKGLWAKLKAWQDELDGGR